METDSQTCGFPSQGSKAAEAAGPGDGADAGSLIAVPWVMVPS